MPIDPLSDTNQQLHKVYTNLAELSGVQVNALTKQTSIMDIVKSENQRLKEKKNTIDQAVENQKRIIYFNDNSRKSIFGLVENNYNYNTRFRGTFFNTYCLFSRISSGYVV
jgi:hypothetical protein